MAKTRADMSTAEVRVHRAGASVSNSIEYLRLHGHGLLPREPRPDRPIFTPSPVHSRVRSTPIEFCSVLTVVLGALLAPTCAHQSRCLPIRVARGPIRPSRSRERCQDRYSSTLKL